MWAVLLAACRSQCKRQSDAATSAAESSLVALRAELEKKAQEMVRLEGEHRVDSGPMRGSQTSREGLRVDLLCGPLQCLCVAACC
jgi:hypothetical protein